MPRYNDGTAAHKTSMTERKYSSDEVDAILGRAIERQHNRGELSHEDLVAAAGEVGVPPEAIESAALEVLAERHQREQLAILRKQEWRAFFSHLVPYLLVNGMLVTLNLLTTHFPWALFPLLGWGIGLVLHFMAIAAPDRHKLELRLESQRDRERRRQLKQRVRSSASQLEQDVGKGISAVLEAAAQRIAGAPGDLAAQSRSRGSDSEPMPSNRTQAGPTEATSESQEPATPAGVSHNAKHR